MAFAATFPVRLKSSFCGPEEDPVRVFETPLASLTARAFDSGSGAKDTSSAWL